MMAHQGMRRPRAEPHRAPSSASGLVLLSVLLALAAGAQAAASGGKLLALLQDTEQQAHLSKFFGALEKAGVQIDYKLAKDASIKLRDYDTWHYDHLAIFAPKAESYGGGLDVRGILEFVDSGRNLILAGSSQASEALRTVAAEVGVDMDDKGTSVYDHFSHAVGSDGQPDHTLVVAKDLVASQAIFGSKAPKGALLFQGVALSVPADSELVTVAVSAPATAYSHDARKAMAEPPALMVGTGITLLALVQARNNARVLVSGSLALFTNELFDLSVTLGPTGEKLGASANEHVATHAALWTLQQRGVLKASNLRHRLVSEPVGSPSPAGYRVTDEVEFAVDIFEYEGGAKKPYLGEDVQVEFVMLDPYVRLPLTPDGTGAFRLAFKVPDVYGVFKYVVDYKHLGYSYVQLTQQVPVRPFKHNEYERFLVCAAPYYASAISGMFAFFFLGWFYLYNKS